MIKISKYNLEYKGYALHKDLLNNFILSDELKLKTREELFIKDISKRGTRKQSVLYTLSIDNQMVGFISFSSIWLYIC